MFDIIYISSFGIGSGLAGALLLAKGILTSPDKLENRAIDARHDYGALLNVQAAQDWADGTAATIFITLGFVLQVAAIIDPGQLSKLPATQKFIALLCAMLGFSIAFALAKLTQWHQIRWYLIKRAHYYGLNGKFSIQRHDLPGAGELISCGYALGKGPNNKEKTEIYMKRVWKMNKGDYNYES